jgi:hypothetical protein
MGYGLDDLETAKRGKIIDPRINTTSILLDEDAFDKKYNTVREALEDYKEFLKNNKERNGLDSSREVDKFEDSNFFNMVTHVSEGGLKSVLCITPLSSLSTYGWRRVDDSMDYAEASLLRNPLKPTVKTFTSGFYPFNASYSDKRTGASLESYTAISLIRAANRIKSARKEEDRDPYMFDYFAKELGFASSKEATDFMVPRPPADIISLATWGELFTAPLHAFDLKPMIYTYWS